MNLNWEKVKQQGTDAPGFYRNGLSLTYLNHINSLLPFGGPLKTNIIYLFSLDHRRWSTQTTQGRRPTSRCFHASYYDQKQQVLYIHGGEAEPGRSLEDLHILFTKNWTWKKVFFRQKDLPVGRHGHSMVGYSGTKIIFGGVYSSENKLLNDTWIIKGDYKYTSHSELLHGPIFQKINTKGGTPAARKHHQAIAFKDQMFVIGGEAQFNKNTLTIFSLSLSTFSWRQIEISHHLKQRSNFSLVLNRNQAVIFGGKQYPGNISVNDTVVFDLQTKKAVKLQVANAPAARFNHCMAVSCSSPFRSWMMGGVDKCQTLEVYQLYENQGSVQQFQINSENYEQYISKLQEQILRQKQEQNRLLRTFQKQSRQPSEPENSSLVEHLLTLIKSQQFLSQELQKKDSTLQRLLKSIQQYISLLNSNYKNFGQQNMEIERVRQNHIYICLKLKEAYKNIERLTSKNLSKIHQSRGDVVNINREFQGFMQTEIDQQI